MIYNLHEMLTSPILITTLYIIANPSASTQTIQLLFVCSIGLNMLIIPLSLVIDDEMCETKSNNNTVMLTAFIALILWITQTIIIREFLSDNILTVFFVFNLILFYWKIIFILCAKVSLAWIKVWNGLFYVSRYVHAIMIIACFTAVKLYYIDNIDMWSNHHIVWANVIGIF
jgi:hypothetical protein